MEAKNTMSIVIAFLYLFMPVTLSKRIVSIILLAAGMERSQVAQMVGFCDKTVRMV